MKLVAKKGSKFEQLIKKYLEKAEADLIAAKSLIADFTGVAPVGLGYIWCCGDTRVLQYDEVSFPADSEPKFYKRKQSSDSEDGNAMFAINNRFKASREFGSVFKSFNFGLDGSLMDKFGIHVLSSDFRHFYDWCPGTDDNRRYYIIVPGAMIDDMCIDKKNQFTIESND